MAPLNSTPIVWSIAGADPSSGAGVQMDLKVMHALNTYPCSVLAGLTAQNTQGVKKAEAVAPSFLLQQIQALQEDLPPVVIKTGMLASAENIQIVADFLAEKKVPVVCDPIRAASSGTAFLNSEAREVLIHSLLPQITLLTPNLPELEWLLGEKIEQVERAAEKIIQMGVNAVLIKGGHSNGKVCRDYWTDGQNACWLSSPRIGEGEIHGTGCMLSSAIAAFFAQGKTWFDAVVWAKSFLNQCIKESFSLGKGARLLKISSFRNEKNNFPEIQYT